MLTLRRLGVVILVALGALLAACRGRPQACTADFSKLIPSGWTFVSQISVDTDGSGTPQCVVFYRFDTQTKEGRKITPIGGIVYRQDHGRPRWIYPVPLTVPNNFFLAEAGVTARAADVLSGQDGPELVVEDKATDGTIVEASIFTWRDNKKGDPDAQPDLGQMSYKPLGSFVGDGGVTVEKDKVTVLTRRRDTRSQLADRKIYYPRDNKNYYKPNTGDLVDSVESDIVSLTESDNPVTSPYPEKMVLALYRNLTNDGQLAKLMSAGGLQGLQNGRVSYGCNVDRGQVDRVLIQTLDWTHGTEAQPLVTVLGKCKLKDGSMRDMTATIWPLAKVEGKWQIQPLVR